jgi:hypothetical protein
MKMKSVVKSNNFIFFSNNHLNEDEVVSEKVWIEDHAVDDEALALHELLQLGHRGAGVAGVRKLNR